MQNKGVLSFIGIILIFVFVFCYNGYKIVELIPHFYNEEEIEETQTILEEEISQIKQQEQKPIETPQNEPLKEIKEETQQQAVQTSAEAVKGKIISNYISPYSASLSYAGVNLKNNTSAKIDLKSLLNSELGFKIDQNNQPQVLIMHTHTTESYMLTDSDFYTESFTSRSTDNTKNMVKIGSIIAEKLNSAGIKTIHATKQHDYPKYNGSYTRSGETVGEYLKKYPSIKVVLDIHRDAVSKNGNDKVKLVTEIQGKKAAQVMLVMGSQTGSVKNHSKWKENLKLAVKLQNLLEKDYPTLARPISLVSSRYNQHLTTGSLLLEVGTDANSLEEACYSAELLGNTISKLLK